MALVLTRMVGERVLIGDDVVLIVGGVRGNQVRLIFEAPKHVKIFREELLRNDSDKTGNLFDERA